MRVQNRTICFKNCPRAFDWVDQNEQAVIFDPVFCNVAAGGEPNALFACAYSIKRKAITRPGRPISDNEAQWTSFLAVRSRLRHKERQSCPSNIEKIDRLIEPWGCKAHVIGIRVYGIIN